MAARLEEKKEIEVEGVVRLGEIRQRNHGNEVDKYGHRKIIYELG